MSWRSARAAARRPLGPPAVISVLLHASLLALVALSRPPKPESLPPLYKVDLVAAAPGPRQVGVTTPVTEPAPPEKAPEQPSRAPEKANEMADPIKSKVAPRQAGTQTPNATKEKPSEQTKAGGGPTGDVGTDVVTVQTPGIEFPYPGYLNNIVRQIALNFKPRNASGALRAEVSFLIHRDGSVTNFRFMKQSGSYAFDLDAQGAVEAASAGFGRLPAGYNDDVLPIIFIFEPRLGR